MAERFDEFAFAADDVAAANEVVRLSPAVWERVDRAVRRGQGVLVDGVAGSLHEFAVLGWLVCRAVWAHDASPVFVSSAGRLAGVAQTAEVSTAVARLAKRHTPPDRRAVAVPDVDAAQLACAFAWLCDATVDEVAVLAGVPRDQLLKLWPPAPPIV